MNRDRWRRFRPLYLLALAQLLGGPLLLLQLTLFCKLTVEHAPRHGFSRAIARAWQSNEFQQTLSEASRGGDPVPHERERDAADGKVKSPALPWSGARFAKSAPWWIAGFGLLHGLGFAHSYKAAPPEGGMLGTLVGFNLGIEAGQCLVVGTLWLLCARWRGRPWFAPAIERPACALIALTGVMWAAQRIA